VAGDVLVDSAHGRDAFRDGRHDDLCGHPRAASEGSGPAAAVRAVALPGFERSAFLRRVGALTALAILLAVALRAEKPAPISKLAPSDELDRLVARVAAETIEEFGKSGLTAEGISIAVIDLSPGAAAAALPAAAYRGDQNYYPCSVVKLCYLSFYESQKEAGKLSDNPELVRAVKDMITLSSNDATGFVVDSITGTTSGPEIADAAEWTKWKARREVVNTYYRGRGYTNLNANQKTFCEDAYGREQAFRDDGKNRNRMSAMESARIFKEIVRGEVAGPKLTEEMLALLARGTGPEKLEDVEPEDARLAAQGLPEGSRIWAKSGDAFDFHHLVARIILPNGREFVVAVFTKGVKAVSEIIPRVYEKVAAHFAAPRS